MGLGKDTIPLSEYVAASGSASLIRNRYTPDFCFAALSWADATFPGLLGKFVIIISEFEHPRPRLSIAHPIGECSYLRSPVAPVPRIVQKPSRHHVTLFGPDGSRFARVCDVDATAVQKLAKHPYPSRTLGRP